MDGIAGYIISLVLGGGLLKAIESVFRAVTESKEKKILAESIGAKTPAEVESVSVATMTTALESAQNRILSLEKERREDRDYYLGQISDLKAQLEFVRDEMHSMEKKIANLLADTDPDIGKVV